MKKQFTAQDCIHLFACRRLNKIANKVCYGEKGTQKIARGCNENCICYVSSFDDEAIESLAEEIKEYQSEKLKKKQSNMKSYEQKYKAALEWMQGMYGGLHGKTKEEAEKYFPELAESEDEKIRKAIITFFESEDDNTTYALVPKKDILAWLEKQGKPKWNEEDKEQCDLLIEQLATLKRTLALDFRNEIKWLKSLKQSHDNFEKTCKNDTLLDLLNKIPSCITVDGIDYHFVLKKTIAYMAFYEGEGEGSGKVIFGVTAFSPIDLLTEMLDKLKEKGLLG